MFLGMFCYSYEYQDQQKLPQSLVLGKAFCKFKNLKKSSQTPPSP